MPQNAAGPSVNAKLWSVGGLILVLLVPTLMIRGLAGEREERRNAAVREIGTAWSGSQVWRGPILAVPHLSRRVDAKGKTITTTSTAYLLPETLDIETKTSTETRYRGIYRAPVYTAEISARGRFRPAELRSLLNGDSELLWEKAALGLSLSDLRGVKENVVVRWGDKPLELDAGTTNSPLLQSGLAAAIRLDPTTEPTDFSLKIVLRGSQRLFFVPAGKTTSISMTSTWPTPSFQGSFLPDQREIGPDGFRAAWKVLQINRSLPHRWVGEGVNMDAWSFGVDFPLAVDNYTSTERAIKYAVLFVFLTFLTFFFVEFFNESRLHPVQYLLVGSGIVLFFLLLLSLSEHLPFAAAYGLSTLGVVAVVAGYTQGIFGKRAVTAVVGSLTCSLYGFLYCLLQLEDYALVLGSAALLGILAAVMYLTRKIDWYGLEPRPAAPPPLRV